MREILIKFKKKRRSIWYLPCYNITSFLESEQLPLLVIFCKKSTHSQLGQIKISFRSCWKWKTTTLGFIIEYKANESIVTPMSWQSKTGELRNGEIYSDYFRNSNKNKLILIWPLKPKSMSSLPTWRLTLSISLKIIAFCSLFCRRITLAFIVFISSCLRSSMTKMRTLKDADKFITLSKRTSTVMRFWRSWGWQRRQFGWEDLKMSILLNNFANLLILYKVREF